MKRALLPLIFGFISTIPGLARGQSDRDPLHPLGAPPGFAGLDRPSGIAEAGVGWLTLPGAEVCIDRKTGCSQGDTSLALDLWQLYRQSRRFAFGAGILLALIPTTDAPKQDPQGVQRDHSRR